MDGGRGCQNVQLIRHSEEDSMARQTERARHIHLRHSKCSHTVARFRGYSLVESMVTIAVLAIIAAMAVPSFASLRERTLMRTTMNEIVDLIELARSEALHRARPVTISFNRIDDAIWCLGVREGASACDCLQHDTGADDYCGLAVFPQPATETETRPHRAATDSKRIRMLDTPNFNGASAFTYDPKLGVLADPARAGSITMASPLATDRYRARLVVDADGQVRACSIPHNGMDVTGLELCP